MQAFLCDMTETSEFKQDADCRKRRRIGVAPAGIDAVEFCSDLEEEFREK